MLLLPVILHYCCDLLRCGITTAATVVCLGDYYVIPGGVMVCDRIGMTGTTLFS